MLLIGLDYDLTRLGLLARLRLVRGVYATLLVLISCIEALLLFLVVDEDLGEHLDVGLEALGVLARDLRRELLLLILDSLLLSRGHLSDVFLYF